MVCTELVDKLVIYRKGKLSNMNMPSANKTTRSLKTLLRDIAELIDEINRDIRNINSPDWNKDETNMKNLNENGWDARLIECCRNVNKRNKIKARLELWRRFPATMNPEHLKDNEQENGPIGPDVKPNPNGPEIVQ